MALAEDHVSPARLTVTAICTLDEVDGVPRHGVFSGTALMKTLVPLVHPRMGTRSTAAPAVALLEPPGFLSPNYGAQTPLVSLAAHIACGALRRQTRACCSSSTAT